MRSSITTGSKEHFTTLDAWRGICAMFVAVFHFPAAWDFEWSPMIRGAYLFVDFFFVLSGFVIAYNYFGRLTNASGSGETASFVTRRFGRLWPLHALMLAMFVLRELAKAYITHQHGPMGNIAPFTAASSPNTILPNLLFMHSFGLTHQASWNGPSWSIGAEFFTYIVFALVCLAGRRLALVLAAIIPIIAAIAIALFSPRLINADYDFGFVRCLYGFFVGVILYELFQHRPVHHTKENPYATVTELAVLTLVVLYVVSAYNNFAMMAAPLVFAGAIFVFAQEKGAASILLRTPIFRALGKWSYSIYMVHWFISVAILDIAKIAGSHLHIPMVIMDGGEPVLFLHNKITTDLLVPLYLGIILLTASVTYKFIEDPGRRYFNGLAKRIRVVEKPGAIKA